MRFLRNQEPEPVGAAPDSPGRRCGPGPFPFSPHAPGGGWLSAAPWSREERTPATSSLPVTPMTPGVGIPPIWTTVFAIGKAVSPVWSNPINLGCNRRTCRPPAAAPISAPPHCWASRLDNDGRFGNYSNRGRRYPCRRRSLCCRWRRRCIKVSRISHTQNCAGRDDCGRGRNDKMTHDTSPQ